MHLVGCELGREMARAMTKKRRTREKSRALTARKIFEAAQRSYATDQARVQSYQFNDGQLVHTVFKDYRSFNVFNAATSNNDWVGRNVWATGCGRVLSVGRSTFLSSKKPPNCVNCVSPTRLSIRIDWAGRDE
jgi:hypothetical protein